MSKKLTNNKLNKSARDKDVKMRGSFIRAPGKYEEIKVAETLTLYRYVYTSTFSLVSVFVLLLSLLLQGFHVAEASEIDGSENVNVDIVNEESSVNTVTENENSSENIIDDIKDIESDAKTNSVVEDLPKYEIEVKDEVVSDTDNTIIENSNASVEEITTELVDETIATNTNEYEDKKTPEVDTEISVNNEEVTSSSATTTHESISVVESDSSLNFDKDECTKLEDGSFYCHEVKENQLKDALFSAPDQDGDLEVFLVRDGKQAQITHNNTDDASPYFDQQSNTLVWQRLIDDRFQIISYSLETGEEMQITDGSVNNMEPTRQGQYTVWQRWVNDSWNIVLYDGNLETQITNDDSHNLAPHIQGALVIWNKHNKSGEKTIEMYNIESKSYVTVNDPDGLTVDNPRMVLVYDSLHPNGDIVTKGFDIFTGEFIELDTLPKPLPDIPDSESTTEIRALIQPKPEIKYVFEEKVVLDTFSDPGSDLDSNVDEKTDLSNEDMTLDLSKSTTTSTSTENDTDASNSLSDIIPDLEITPFSVTIEQQSTTTDGV
jgi:hypothetical protein